MHTLSWINFEIIFEVNIKFGTLSWFVFFYKLPYKVMIWWSFTFFVSIRFFIVSKSPLFPKKASNELTLFILRYQLQATAQFTAHPKRHKPSLLCIAINIEDKTHFISLPALWSSPAQKQYSPVSRALCLERNFYVFKHATNSRVKNLTPKSFINLDPQQLSVICISHINKIISRQICDISDENICLCPAGRLIRLSLLEWLTNWKSSTVVCH